MPVPCTFDLDGIEVAGVRDPGGGGGGGLVLGALGFIRFAFESINSILATYDADGDSS